MGVGQKSSQGVTLRFKTKIAIKMSESQIKEATAHYEQALRQWVQSQSGQTDAYEYEKSFVSFSRSTAQHTLQSAVGELPVNKNAKKK
jgi:hypothetical protein